MFKSLLERREYSCPGYNDLLVELITKVLGRKPTQLEVGVAAHLTGLPLTEAVVSSAIKGDGGNNWNTVISALATLQ